MNDGKVRTCNTTFTGAHDDDDLVMTFEPTTAGAKIRVNFTDMDIEDYFVVFDGPDM